MITITQIIKNITKYRILRENGGLSKEVADKLAFIEKGVNGLSNIDKEFMVMYINEGLSLALIASHMHVTRSGLYKKINRIGKELEDIYQELKSFQ
ncbi:MAG: hypothetical protein R3Y65_00585 [Bacillota bacterium]